MVCNASAGGPPAGGFNKAPNDSCKTVQDSTPTEIGSNTIVPIIDVMFIAPSDAVTRYIRWLDHMATIAQWKGDNPDTLIKLVFLINADPLIRFNTTSPKSATNNLQQLTLSAIVLSKIRAKL